MKNRAMLDVKGVIHTGLDRITFVDLIGIPLYLILIFTFDYLNILLRYGEHKNVPPLWLWFFYDSFGRVVKLCQIKSTGWAIYELLDSELKRWTYLNHSFSHIIRTYAQKTSLFHRNIWLYCFLHNRFWIWKWLQNVQRGTQNTTWTSFWKIHYVCTNCVLLRHNKWNSFIYPSMSKYRKTQEDDLVFGVQIC